METFGLDQGLTDQAKTTLSAMLRGMLLCGLLCAGRDGEDEVRTPSTSKSKSLIFLARSFDIAGILAFDS